ncbi:MAG: hypothetical protein LBB39_00980, partial [Mycoplasmataceae bacterium]|nr:hypothetical protein [Mycoplasmataceae bacterium]
LNMERERKEDKEEARRIREEDRLENKTFQKNIIDEFKEVKGDIKEIKAKQDKMEKDINNIVEKNNLKR